MSARDIYTNSTAGLAVFGLTSCAGEAFSEPPIWSKIYVGLISLAVAALLVALVWLFDRYRSRKGVGSELPSPAKRPRRKKKVSVRLNGLRPGASMSYEVEQPPNGPFVAAVAGLLGGLAFVALG